MNYTGIKTNKKGYGSPSQDSPSFQTTELLDNKIKTSIDNKNDGLPTPRCSAPISRRDMLPGVSYVPDPLEIDDDVRVKSKVLAEFIDFLDCVADQLQLVSVVTSKHLHSSVPMPFGVIREIRVYPDRPGTRRQKYEMNVVKSYSNTSRQVQGSHNHPQRRTLSQRFSRNISSMDNLLSVLTHKHKTRRTTDPTQAAPAAEGSQEIMIKYKKPIWQTVAMEKRKAPLKPSIAQKIQKPPRPKPEATEVVKSKQISLPVFRTKSEELMSRIEFADAMKVPTSNPRVRNQMDMLSAYFTGFKDVKQYKAHLEAQQPHWFGDLLKVAVNGGMMCHAKVVRAFERLGHYYHNNERSDPLGKAKLCFIVQSLPIWDVTRITVQRATEFILSEIYKVSDAPKTLLDWLEARDLPYVILPPIIGNYSIKPSESSKASEVDITKSESFLTKLPSILDNL